MSFIKINIYTTFEVDGKVPEGIEKNHSTFYILLCTFWELLAIYLDLFEMTNPAIRFILREYHYVIGHYHRASNFNLLEHWNVNF